MLSVTKNPVRHAWREPLYGALRNWLDFWYLRILWAILLAAIFAFIRGLSRSWDIDGAVQAFFPACGVAILIIGMYALIQRRIDMYDDCLVIVHGRGGSRYRYSDISSIVVETSGKHPSLIICLKSGKKSEVFFGADLSLPTVTGVLIERGVKCVVRETKS